MHARALFAEEAEEFRGVLAPLEPVRHAGVERGGLAKALPSGKYGPHALGATPSQVGLAWLLQHVPNVLLIPGTADLGYL